MPLTAEQVQAINDGDTVRLKDGRRVRFTGFDAPEMGHADTTGLAEEPGARLSTQLTAEYLAQPGATINPTGRRDPYNRELAPVTNAGHPSLAQEQLRRGLAFVGDDDPANSAAFYKGAAERRRATTPAQQRLNEVLDEQWSRATPNAHNVRKTRQRGLGEVFGDALDRGLDQVGLMAGGMGRLAGELVGSDALVARSNRLINDKTIDVGANAPDIGTLDKADNVGDLVTWAVEKLGEQTPNIAAIVGTSALTGGTGTVLGAGGAAAAKLAGQKVAAKAAANAMSLAGKGLTRELGAIAAGGTLNIGETKLSLDAEDPGGDHNMLALSAGLMKTTLDLGSMALAIPGMSKMLLPRLAKMGVAPKALTTIGQIPTSMAKAALIEGGTEGLQELIDEVAIQSKNANYDISWGQIRESAAVGALVGPAFGGVGGVAEVGLHKMTEGANKRSEDRLNRDTGTTPEERRSDEAELQGLMARRNAGDVPPEVQARIDAIYAKYTPPEGADTGMSDDVRRAARESMNRERSVAEESNATVRAQAAAVADPEHPKKVGYVADGSDMSAIGDVPRIRIHDGTEGGFIYGPDKTALVAIREAVDAGASVQQVLAMHLYNGAETIDEVAASGEPATVVQNVTPEGAPVTEVVARESDAERVAAVNPPGKGEAQRTVTPEQALAERATASGMSVEERAAYDAEGITFSGPLTPKNPSPSGSAHIEVSHAARAAHDAGLSAIHEANRRGVAPPDTGSVRPPAEAPRVGPQNDVDPAPDKLQREFDALEASVIEQEQRGETVHPADYEALRALEAELRERARHPGTKPVTLDKDTTISPPGGIGKGSATHRMVRRLLAIPGIAKILPNDVETSETWRWIIAKELYRYAEDQVARAQHNPVRGRLPKAQGSSSNIVNRLMHEYVDTMPDAVLEDFVNKGRFEKHRLTREGDPAPFGFMGRALGVNNDTSTQAGLARGRTAADSDDLTFDSSGRSSDDRTIVAEERDAFFDNFDEEIGDQAKQFDDIEDKKRTVKSTAEQRAYWTEFANRLAKHGIAVPVDAKAIFELFRTSPLFFKRSTASELADKIQRIYVERKRNPISPEHALHYAAAVVRNEHTARLKQLLERHPKGSAPNVRERIRQQYMASKAAAIKFRQQLTPALRAELADMELIARDPAETDVKSALTNTRTSSNEQAVSHRQARRNEAAVRNPLPLEKVEHETATEDAVPDEVALSDKLFGMSEEGFTALDAAIANMPKTNSAHEIAVYLGKHVQNPVLKMLLAALRPFLHTVDISFGTFADESFGSFDPAARRMVIRRNLRPSQFFHAFLHEALHAATYNGLRENRAFNSRITALRAMAQKLANAARVKDKEILYGLTSNDEFVAQLFSSPAFIDWLAGAQASVKAEQFFPLQTLLQRIVSAIRDMLGLSKDTSIAAEAMEAVLVQLARGPRNDDVEEYDVDARRADDSQVFSGPIGESWGDFKKSPLAKGIRLHWKSSNVRDAMTAAQAGQFRAAGRSVASAFRTVGGVILDANEWLLSSQWQMQRLLKDTDFGESLSQMWNRQPGRGRRMGLIQRAIFEANAKSHAWNAVVKKHGAEAVTAAWVEIEQARAAGVTEDSTLSPAAKDLRGFFRLMSDYIRDAGVHGYNEETMYLPQVHDKVAIQERQAEFIRFLRGFKFTDPWTGKEAQITNPEEFLDGLLGRHGHAAHADIPWAGSLQSRIITDPAYTAAARAAGFLHKEPSTVIDYYISSVTKQTEFERLWGGYVEDNEGSTLHDSDSYIVRSQVRGLYGIRGSLDDPAVLKEYRRAYDRAVREGALIPTADGVRVWQRDYYHQMHISAITGLADGQRKAARYKTIVDGYMGNLGADMNPTWRKSQQWMLVLQTVTTLAFSTVSSLPELGVLMAQAPSMTSLIKGMAGFATSPRQAFATLDALNLSSARVANVALMDSQAYRDMHGLPRAIIDTFFKINFQNRWTEMTKAMTLQIGLSAFQERAQANDAEFFRDFGITPQRVTAWMAAGMPAHEQVVNTTIPNYSHPVVRALDMFIGERVVLPNAAMKPVWMNDPRVALIAQLKSFFYAYGSVITVGMARKAALAYTRAVDNGDTKAAASVQAAVPYVLLGLFGLPLAALAGELKDLIKYEMWGEEAPTWRDKEGLALYADLTRKVGVFGPIEQAFMLFEGRKGGVGNLLGPTAAHIDLGLEKGFFSEDMLRRTTPILGQMPGWWDDDGV